MPMEHINITLPKPLREELDHWAFKEHTKRSSLIQKTIRLYLDLAEEQKLQQLLREGYEKMSQEMTRITKEFQTLDQESLKYDD